MRDIKVEKYIGIKSTKCCGRIPKEYCDYLIEPAPLEMSCGIIDGEEVIIIKKAYKTTKKSQ